MSFWHPAIWRRRMDRSQEIVWDRSSLRKGTVADHERGQVQLASMIGLVESDD